MSTVVATTLKISGDLKRRVVAAAKAADKSPHAFMLEAIEHQTRQDEERRAFVANAVAARSEALKSGQGGARARPGGGTPETANVAQVIYSWQAFEDLDRLADFLFK
jgi:predicted transcriptional regulator